MNKKWWQISYNGTHCLYMEDAAAAAESLHSCLTLCDPIAGSPPGSPSLGFSRQEPWSGLPFPSPMHACMLSRLSRVRLCDPKDSSPPGSSVHRILWARILEWVAISFSTWNMRWSIFQSEMYNDRSWDLNKCTGLSGTSDIIPVQSID